MLPVKKHYEFNEVMEIFELSWTDVPDIRQPTKTFEEMDEKVKEFKKIFKSAYRKMVKKYHPDHGGSEMDFIVIQNLYEFIMENVKPIQRVHRPPTIRVVHYYHYRTNYTTASSTSYY